MTPKQARFVDEYLVDLNASAAAVRAGYSAKLSNTNAFKLLQNTAVAAAIAERQAEISERLEVTQVGVIADLRRLARKAEKAGAFAPAIRARELIGKHIGMFWDKVQLSGPQGGPIQLQRIERVIVRPSGNTSDTDR